MVATVVPVRDNICVTMFFFRFCIPHSQARHSVNVASRLRISSYITLCNEGRQEERPPNQSLAGHVILGL